MCMNSKPMRIAIGAAQDRQHFANGRIFEAEHVIEKNLAIVIRLGEAIGRRMQLFIVLWLFDAERIQPGVQMAAHAIGADHHQRAHRIASRALHVGRRCAIRGPAGQFRLGAAIGSAARFAPSVVLAQSPSSAEISSPLAATGQFGLRQCGPLAPVSTAARSSPSCAKKARHSGSTEFGSRSKSACSCST